MRAYVECLVSGTVLRFVYPCGHKVDEDINKGKPKHLRLSEEAAKHFASYWSKEKGGVFCSCPICARKFKAGDRVRRTLPGGDTGTVKRVTMRSVRSRYVVKVRVDWDRGVTKTEDAKDLVAVAVVNP